MATDNKTSVLVEQLLPDFLDTEGPKFQSFVKAYYEWMEQTGQMTEQSKNLLNNQDIDLAAEEFLTYFKREILPDFPEDILADKRLVYKKIKDLYRSKGSEESYKLLFRILYDEELDFYYPGQDILRASDGRWIQETSLRITKPFRGNPDLLAGEITGRQSGATAKIERVQQITTDGIEVYEVFVTNIEGTFLDAELIDNTANSISGTIISSAGTLQNVIVTDGGSGHQRNDLVTITSASGSGGRGRVTITANGVISKVAVTNAGSGFIRTDPLTLFNTSRSAVNATAAGLLSAPISYTGRYNDVKGFISWSNKLQDNRYYQEYSYVLRSSQVLNTYKEIVKNVVHPAGMRLFGDVLINVDINNSTTNIRSDEHTVYIHGITPTDIFIPRVVSSSIDQYEASGDDGGVVPRPEIEIEQIETFFDIDIPEAGSGFQLEIELIAAQTSALTDADSIVESQIQRIIEGFTINPRTANLALLQIGDIWDTNVPSYYPQYSNTGAVWLANNGVYLPATPSDTQLIQQVAVGLIEINDGIDVVRGAGLETVNTAIMSYSDLPIYALEDTLKGVFLFDTIDEYANTTINTIPFNKIGEYDYTDSTLTFPLKGYVEEPRTNISTYSSNTLNNQVADFESEYPGIPTDWTVAHAPVTFTLGSAITFGDFQQIERDLDGFSPITSPVSEWLINEFANTEIAPVFTDLQLNEELTIITTTFLPRDSMLKLSIGTVNDDLTLGANTATVPQPERIDMFFDSLAVEGDEVGFFETQQVTTEVIEEYASNTLINFANVGLNSYWRPRTGTIFDNSANVVPVDIFISRSFDALAFVSDNPIDLIDTVPIEIYQNLTPNTEYTVLTTTAFSNDAEMYNQGTGTVTLAYVDNVQDVQDELVGNFEQGQVDSLEGTRRWVEGIGTAFTTETSNTNYVMIRDSGNTNTLVYNQIQYVDDANTLFLTSNVAITIVDGDIFYRN